VALANLDLMRRSNEAFRRGDFDAWASNFDQDVLVRTDPSWPEQRIYGRDAVVQWGRGTWESLGRDLRLEEVNDLGDRVLARNRWVTRGRESGVEAELRWSEIATVRDGRFVLIEMFLDHGDALRTLGLQD
jgi:ketosteroid isomerase-like protein